MTPRTRSVASFFALACAITWICALPAVLAWLRHVEPPAYALPLLGLSALGPTVAAVIVAARRRELGGVFRPWRTNPIWIVIALFTPMFLQIVAKLIELLLGGQPSTWVQLPDAPERIVALVLFSVGEEFGWRGFAQPRLVERHGPVVGAVIVGAMWSIWHLMYIVSPETGEIDRLSAMMMLVLPLYSIIFVWFMRRTGGSMAIALALHAGGHLDNINRIPQDEIRIRVLTLVVVGIAAFLAARSLSRRAKSQ